MLPPTGQEPVVRAALLPDPPSAIDATLGQLHPLAEEDGFTCIAYLAETEEPLKAVVRKVLAAGSAIGLVRPDDQADEAYQVHSDFYRLLAQLRTSVPHQATLRATLTNALKTGVTETLAPTEADARKALADLNNGLSEYVILDRMEVDKCADFFQTAGGPPFRVECKIWLNDSFGEQFQITDASTESDFTDIIEVERIMLYWYRTGRLPDDVAIKNITDELP
jgi:hypothetical protein